MKNNTSLLVDLRPAFYVLTVMFSLLMASCSLVRIESEQTPLDKVELNTRILTQAFAKEALERIEYAADSIILLSTDDTDVQINALIWKIQTSKELGRLSFQTEPRIALLDTWSYFLEVREAMDKEEMKGFFGDYKPIAIATIDKNIQEIEKIASHMLTKNEFEGTKGFVEEYARTTPLFHQSRFKHKSIREAYLDYRNIPDSLAFQTVGTLSEVVADATNRFGYLSDASSKRLTWQTQKLLKENGIDSINVQSKLDEIDRQFERLLLVAENAPEDFEEAIIEFRKNVSPLFESLNYEIRRSMKDVSTNLDKVDQMLLRERAELDTIIQRERQALTVKADELVETGIEKAFDGISDMIRNIIIYLIILLLILFGVPFYLGYLLGKRKSK